MSSSGISPLAIIAPDLYAKQLGIGRRQALGQALMQNGMDDPGKAAFGGLRNAGNSILGALLLKNADSDMSNLYTGGGSSQGPEEQIQPGQDTGQITNAARPAGVPITPPGADETDAEGNPIGSPTMGQAAPQPAAASPAPQGSMAFAQPSHARSIGQALGGALPDVPGMSHQQSMLMYMSDQPDYWKDISPTPEFRNAMQAAGGDPRVAQQFLLGAALKNSSTTMRPGGGNLNNATGQITTMPNTNGIQTTFPQGAGGPAQMGMVPGATQALSDSAAATRFGQGNVTGATGYDTQGMPQGTNYNAMYGIQPPPGVGGPPQSGGQPPQPPAQGGQSPGSLIAGINPGAVQAVESGGNPNAVSPAGARGPMQAMPQTLTNPGFGVRPAQDNSPQEQARVGQDYLSAMMQKYKNPTLAHIAYNWGPGNTDQWLQSGGDYAKLPPTVSNYLGSVAVAQAVPQRGARPIQYGAQPGQGQQPQQPQQPQAQPQGVPAQGQQPLRPELPRGQGPYMDSQGKDAADRHDETVAAAAESPMRINVLDNIMSLAKQGVATGPGQAWQNQLKGYIANTPGVSSLLPKGMTADLSNFQELQKFTYQNALRNWQAAGGTGTDRQMESMSTANPNDHLFPQALLGISKWAKASELAIQGKANAQDRFLAQNGNTPGSQIKFENTWRNAFDPRVFQYGLMEPGEQAALAKQLGPKGAQGFLARQQQLKAMGAIQ